MSSTTLEDISRASGFSLATVSRVLSNSTYPVSDTTRQRILKIAQSLEYRPNLYARGLRTEHTNTVGILVDDIVSVFTPPLVRGIQDYLNEHAISCLVMNSDWRPDIETMAIENLLGRSVDGIIFVEYSHLVTHNALIRSRKPHLFVHRLFGTSIRNSILPDDYYGAMLAMNHLLNLGHQRIAYVGGPNGWHSNKHRFNAYRDALTQHGLRIDPLLVQNGDWECDSGYAAVRRLLEQTERPTALFAANDLMALGAIYALQDAGIGVPNDVAVIGYDDRDFAKVVRPNLTTVSLPTYEMGQIAAQKLMTQIQEGMSDFNEILVKGTLYVRETCGADPSTRTQKQRIRMTDTRPLMLNKDPEH